MKGHPLTAFRKRDREGTGLLRIDKETERRTFDSPLEEGLSGDHFTAFCRIDKRTKRGPFDCPSVTRKRDREGTL